MSACCIFSAGACSPFGRKGRLPGDEFIDIRELSLNPIAQVMHTCVCVRAHTHTHTHTAPARTQRIVRLFESINFKEFVALLAPFSVRAPREAKIEAMFNVYDVDGDGECARAHTHTHTRRYSPSPFDPVAEHGHAWPVAVMFV